MIPVLFVGFAICFLVAIVLFQAGIQTGFSRYFGIANANFKTSLKIVLWLGIPELFFGIPFFPGIQWIGVVVIFFVFHRLLIKYYSSTSFKQNLKIYTSCILVAVFFSTATVVPIRHYFIEPFVVAGSTMFPNFVDKNYLLINKYDKDFKRGDVVILKYPIDPTKYFIKRIIGLPGEEVSFADEKVLVNGLYIQEEYLNQPTGVASSTILKSDEYFVMGDNRGQSSDSRRWGPVRLDLLIGKVWLKIF